MTTKPRLKAKPRVRVPVDYAQIPEQLRLGFQGSAEQAERIAALEAEIARREKERLTLKSELRSARYRLTQCKNGTINKGSAKP